MREWLWAPALIYTGILVPSLLLAPPADAAMYINAADVVVAVGWSGASCINMNEPDPRTSRATVTNTFTCAPEQGVAIRYTAHTGEWVGVDPIEQPGVAVACEVAIDGVTVMKETGMYGVSCLSRLP